MALQDAGAPLCKSATGSAAGAVSVSLTPAAGRLAYIQGFTVTSTNPVANQNGVVTVSGVATQDGLPLSYQFVESTTFGGELLIIFPDKGLAASTVGNPITISLPAITSGGAGAIAAYGYQL